MDTHISSYSTSQQKTTKTSRNVSPLSKNNVSGGAGVPKEWNIHKSPRNNVLLNKRNELQHKNKDSKLPQFQKVDSHGYWI